MPALFLMILLLLPLQSPVQEAPDPVRVRIGLVDGGEVLVEDARFMGFIRTREDGAILYYRLPHLQGEMPLAPVARIDMDYRRGRPFPLVIRLEDGRQIEATSDRQHFLEIRGRTENGTVTIRHPDPLVPPPDASPGSPNREDDLTIEYIEFLDDDTAIR